MVKQGLQKFLKHKQSIMWTTARRVLLFDLGVWTKKVNWIELTA